MADGVQRAKKTKKGRKHGRNKSACQLYRGRQQRERNKARRLVRHLKKFPADNVAVAALKALPSQFAKQAA